MGNCSQCAENEVKLSKYEEKLKTAKEAITASDAEIEALGLSLRDTLNRNDTSESSAVLYTLASKLYEGLYKRKYDEAGIKRKLAEGGVTKSDKEVCDLGHEFVEILVNREFTQESIQQRYLEAEKAISEIMEIEKELIYQGLLDKTGVRKSQKQLCSVLRQQASSENPDGEGTAKEKLKRVEMMHRSIWEGQDEAQGLDQDDEWVLENGHQLGLVLAELKQDSEDHYCLAGIQLKQVWLRRKSSLAFGPTHEDTVDSALQFVSMLERQSKLDEKQKSSEIEGILREIWSNRDTRLSVGMLNCGHKLGDHLYQQKRYADAETVLKEVWTARKDALGQVSKEADDARLTGFVLACALYYQRAQENYDMAKAVLKKLWARRKFYMSPEVSPSNDSIGWQLAWTYRWLEEHAKAEPLFQSIWESRKNDLGPNHIKTLTAQYELGLTQGDQNHWAEAENTFQHIWDKRKDAAEGESERYNRAGYQLGLHLSEQKLYQTAIEVLMEVYGRRVATLGEDDKDTKTTQRELEEAKEALAFQMEEEEANADKQRKREEKEANDNIAREEALREEGREEIRNRGRYR